MSINQLESALISCIRGEVRFDSGSRALYATDSSNYRQVPIGVVVPLNIEDVVNTVALCQQFAVPLLSRGCGTSLAGQCCNVAVVMDMSKYLNHLLRIDPRQKRARVQPGIILDDLRQAAEKHHLTFAPDPATHSHCTLGGMIGNNSCGVHSVMGGKTVDNVEALEILTYRGLRLRVGPVSEEELTAIISGGKPESETYARLKSLRDRYAELIRGRYPQIPRRVSGYNLDQLLPENGFHVARALVGSESTLVTVLEAELRLCESPPARSLLVLGYGDVFSAGDHVPEVLGFGPIALEGIDDRLIDDIKRKEQYADNTALLPPGGGFLLVEFGGETQEEADAKARLAMRALAAAKSPPAMKLFADPREAKKVWLIRESALGATANVPGKPLTWEGWEDSAVAPEKVGSYLRALRKLLDRYGYSSNLYGHFGEGCIHTRIDFGLETTEGRKKMRAFVNEAADLVVSFGGSISGEHGDGQSKAELLPKMYGPELIRAFEEFKTIWDPDWKMNPGKIVKPFGITQNLRLGPHYRPLEVDTHFRFPADQGSFARAMLRCVGVGNCRRRHDGTMCPSFMITREEEDTTRGRARMLFEMLQGDVVKKGFRDHRVRESLDLCLACKGCKAECPTSVDMATYKAEFLAHYYKGRLRPRHAYSMGLIDIWARLGSHFPRLANYFAQARGFGSVLKAVGGISQRRQLPPFAEQTFKRWFAERPLKNPGAPQVILWADTFTNHFHPEIGKAAVEVLESAGFQVQVPQEPLCCGRPLYDFGMLPRAKTKLCEILADLQPQLEAGLPIVGLEPSCVAVFRDEMLNLLPNNEDAKRLSQQIFLFAEFLSTQVKGLQLPRLGRKAVLHQHCHQKSVLKRDAQKEYELLEQIGLDVTLLDSGCCGMAGSFGFERKHAAIADKIGERVLLPAVRAAAPETLIVADGFSCREQIRENTDRRALHLAEVLQMALHEAAADALSDGKSVQ